MLCALEGNHVFEEISVHHGNHLTWGAGHEYSRHALTTQVIASWKRWDREDLTTMTEAFFVYSTHPPVACLKTPLPSRFFPKGRRGLYPGYPLAGRQPLRL